MQHSSLIRNLVVIRDDDGCQHSSGMTVRRGGESSSPFLSASGNASSFSLNDGSTSSALTSRNQAPPQTQKTLLLQDMNSRSLQSQKPRKELAPRRLLLSLMVVLLYVIAIWRNLEKISFVTAPTLSSSWIGSGSNSAVVGRKDDRIIMPGASPSLWLDLPSVQRRTIFAGQQVEFSTGGSSVERTRNKTSTITQMGRSGNRNGTGVNKNDMHTRKEKGNKSKFGLSRSLGEPRPVDEHSSRSHSSGTHKKPLPTLEQTGLLKNLIIIPEYQLVFCYIEKVGCSMFNQLFRILRMYHADLPLEERRFLAANRYGRLHPGHYNMSVDNVAELLADDSWTKAIFFRDPADRFLSAFKSKCGGADWDGAKQCANAFGGNASEIHGMINIQPILGGDSKSFQQAIELTMNSTSRVMKNRHFNKAANFCGGLDGSLDYYHLVQSLHKDTVQEHLKILFDHVGVDPQLTEGLLERVVGTGGTLHLVDLEYFTKRYGIELKSTVPESHNTVSHSEMTTPQQYFGSSLQLERLQNIYQEDYDLFQLQPPTFQDLYQAHNIVKIH